MMDLSPKPLGPRQLAQFHEQGFLLTEPLFTPAQIEQLKHATNRLAEMGRELNGMVMHKGSQFVVEQLGENTGDQLRIHRVVWCGGAIPELLALGQSPALLNRVGQLIESDSLVQIINQIHLKFPGDGVEFPFHQDSQHRKYGTDEWQDVTGKGSYVQTVCAIDEVTLENGPLLVIPGSHKRGHLGLDYPEQFEESLPEGILASDAIAVPMQPGQVLFFGPYLIHGSRANQSADPRRIFINGFAVPGANKREYPGCGTGVEVSVRG